MKDDEKSLRRWETKAGSVYRKILQNEKKILRLVSIDPEISEKKVFFGKI